MGSTRYRDEGLSDFSWVGFEHISKEIKMMEVVFFIIISSPSRLPHFQQELFINKWNSLVWDFIQHNIIWESKQTPKLPDCHRGLFPLFLTSAHP